MQPVFETEINKYIEHWQSSSCFEKPALPAFPLFPPQLLYDLIRGLGSTSSNQIETFAEFGRHAQKVFKCWNLSPLDF